MSKPVKRQQTGLIGLVIVVSLGLLFIFRDRLELPTLTELKQSIFPCQTPITYSLGNFDERFELSQTDFLATLAQAEQLWEDSIGLELFEHTDSGSLIVNLIYDVRQAGTERLQELGLNLDSTSQNHTALSTEYDETYALYLSQSTELDGLIAAHAVHSQAYEAEVARFTANGRAGPAGSSKIESDRQALNAEAEAIYAKIASVNTLAQTVNDLVLTLNDLAERLNLTVDRYNTVGDTLGDEFVEGTFGAGANGNAINIYQFENQAKLVRVLAHELGHALGLDHVEDPDAVMYRLNESENASLTAADVSALNELCQID